MNPSDLSLQDFKASPQFQAMGTDDKVRAMSLYFSANEQKLQNAGATSEHWTTFAQLKRESLNELTPESLKPVNMPTVTEPEVGAMENFGNAFYKGLASFAENIYFQLIKDDPVGAQTFRENMDRMHPTRSGFSETLGTVTSNVAPSLLALATVPLTGGASGATLAATLFQASAFSANAAGGALGQIREFERTTGQDVGQFKTATVMAGHALAEMVFEGISFAGAAKIAKVGFLKLSDIAAGKLGQTLAAGSAEATQKGLKETLESFAKTHGAKFMREIGGIATTEGATEFATQVAQNWATGFYNKDVKLMDGASQAAYLGALGGTVMGPFAMALGHASQQKLHKSLVESDKKAIEFLQKETPAAKIDYDENDRLTGTFAEVIGANTEAAGMAGIGVVPVRIPDENAFRGTTVGNTTFVNVAHPDFAGGNAEAMAQYIFDHERWHATFNKIPQTREFLATVIKSSPEFSAYNIRMSEATARMYQNLGAEVPTPAGLADISVDEVLADFATQYEPTPEFQKAMRENAKFKDLGFFFLRRLKKANNALSRFRAKSEAMLADPNMPLDAARRAKEVVGKIKNVQQVQQALVQTYTSALAQAAGVDVFSMMQTGPEEPNFDFFGEDRLYVEQAVNNPRNLATMRAHPGASQGFTMRAMTDDISQVSATPFNRNNLQDGDVIRTADGSVAQVEEGRLVPLKIVLPSETSYRLDDSAGFRIEPDASIPIPEKLDVKVLFPAGSREASMVTDRVPIQRESQTTRPHSGRRTPGSASTLRFSAPEMRHVDNTFELAVHAVVPDEEVARRVDLIRSRAPDLAGFAKIIRDTEISNKLDEVELTCALRTRFAAELMDLQATKGRKRGSKLAESGFDSWTEVEAAVLRNFSHLAARRHALGFELRTLQWAVALMTGDARYEHEITKLLKAAFAGQKLKVLNVSADAFQQELRRSYAEAKNNAAARILERLQESADNLAATMQGGFITPDEAITTLAQAARILFVEQVTGKKGRGYSIPQAVQPAMPDYPAPVKAKLIKLANEIAGADAAFRKKLITAKERGIRRSILRTSAFITELSAMRDVKAGAKADMTWKADPGMRFASPEQEAAWRREVDEIAADPEGYLVRLTGGRSGVRMAKRLSGMGVDVDALERTLRNYSDLDGGPTDLLAARIIAQTGGITGDTKLSSLPATAQQQVAQLIKDTPELEALRTTLPPPNLARAEAVILGPDEYRAALEAAFDKAAKAAGFEGGLDAFIEAHPEANEVIEQSFTDLPARVTVSRATNEVLHDTLLSIRRLVKNLHEGEDTSIPVNLTQEVINVAAARGFEIEPATAEGVAGIIENYLRKRIDDQVALDGDVERQKQNKAISAARAYANKLISVAEGRPVTGRSARDTLIWMLEKRGEFVGEAISQIQKFNRGQTLMGKNEPVAELAEALGLPPESTKADIEAHLTTQGIPQRFWSAAMDEFAEVYGINLREVLYDATGDMKADLIERFTDFIPDPHKADAERAANVALDERAKTLLRQWVSAIEGEKTPKERIGFYDKLARLSSIGALSGSGTLGAVADFVGIKNLTEAKLAELKAMVDEEARLMKIFKNPESVEVVKQNLNIQDFLTRAAIEQWNGNELIIEQLRKGFYGSALSGIGTVLGTNPLGSASRGLSVIVDELARRMTRAGGGIVGTAMKAAATGVRRVIAGDTSTVAETPRMSNRDIMELLSVTFRAFAANGMDELTTTIKTGATPMREVREKYNELNTAETKFSDFVDTPGLKGYVAATDLISKYVGRAMKAGDAVFFSAMNEFGSAIELWDDIRGADPTLSVEETWNRIRDRMGVTEAGIPQDRYVRAANEMLTEAYGAGKYNATQVNVQATQLAREARDPKVKARGMAFGQETTYTQDFEPTSTLAMIRATLNKIKSKRTFTGIAATFVVPFTNIATGMIDAMMDYHPATSWMGIRKAFAKSADATLTADEKARWARIYETRVTRSILGATAVLGYFLLALLADDGDDDPTNDVFEVTGRGPSDPRARAQWLEAGNRPFKVRIGSFKIDYRVLPIMPVLYGLGAINDAKYEGDPQSALGMALSFGASAGAAITDQSYASSIADLLDLAKSYRANDAGWDKKALDFFLNPVMTSVVPMAGGFRSIQSAFNPEVEATITDTPGSKIYSSVLAKIPIAGDMLLPKKVNALGSDVIGDAFYQKLPMVPSWGFETDNQLDEEIFNYVVKNRTALPMPLQGRTAVLPAESDLSFAERKKLEDKKGVFMTTEEYINFLRQRGEFIRTYYSDNKAELESLSREDADVAIRKIAEIASLEAKRTMLGLGPRRPGATAPKITLRRTIREAIKKPDRPAEE